MGQEPHGLDNEHQAPLFINHVLDNQRRNGPQPDGCLFYGQVVKGFTELRVNTEAGIGILDGLNSLPAQPRGHRAAEKAYQFATHQLGIDNAVGDWRLIGGAHRC